MVRVLKQRGIRPLDLAAALHFDYVKLMRWIRTGPLRATIAPPRGAGRGHDVWLSLDDSIEAFVLIALRREGAPLQRLRRVVAFMRRNNLDGARWLALRSTGGDVLIRKPGRLASVLSGQRYMALIDLVAIRQDVQRLTQRRRRATA